jgi:protein-disulfide isomerase
MTLGSPKAPVTVIEYASASCPHCARFNNEVFPAFKAKYIDTGKVRYAFREFLTQPVELAAATYLIARCAGSDKYFQVLDGVFHAQTEIYQTGEMKGPMLKIAKDAGLDEAAVNACLADQKAIAAMNGRVKTYATRDQITGTPTFVVDGERLVGEQTLDQLDTAIAAAEARLAAKPVRHRAHAHG